MFRTFAQASFKRSLHTSTARIASSRPTRAHAVLAASAVATSYFVWMRVCVASKSKQVPLTPKTAASPEALAHSDSTAPQHEPSIPHDSTLTPDASNAESKSEGEGEESSGGAGGAYNPETGEINWDCPCLGGMAYGPCGMQFREAFSCFIYSEADPKGLDCVEKFKLMQQCFREHPEVYGDDHLRDDDDEEDEFAPDAAAATGGAVVSPTELAPSVPASEPAEAEPAPPEQEIKPRKASAPAAQ
ncbi:hypothetical protein K466DRAFT_494514 [Polyporus arcularius HHB13444]|uniref:Mitochondrial intermembrane space import and assembly protein 40 n=1 Tax=Polyporus arcularius HHB13444 TaxID=1314778 RepID=A0A5C3P8F3_9APHY|nr:hypothetical protein K466DRAFT_494514 [Polyporus arcularius HHB13444]